jgi:hypothetical protein
VGQKERREKKNQSKCDINNRKAEKIQTVHLTGIFDRRNYK